MIPYSHQSKIINEDKKKVGLWLGTGSGKTFIALSLARGKTLIIVPKTQFEDRNWQREADKMNVTRAEITVISKEMFRKQAQFLPRFDTVIGEEAHVLLGVTPNIRYVKKEPRPKASQLFEALDEFITRTNPDRLYLCTATIIRSPMTVWAASKLLNRDFDFYMWREAFYTRLPIPGRDIWVPKKDEKTKDRLAKVVQALGYTGRLSDYFDVPDQIYKTFYLELKDDQKKRIKELQTEYPDPIVLLGKKHQVENGVLKGNEFSEAESFKCEKLEKLEELALEFPKMVVFAKYTAQIAQIATLMNSLGKKVFVLDGATKDRGELISEANNSEEAVFIAQCQVSAGWELPDYPVMVFASLDYSVVSYLQGIGRILRANALKKNLYIHLIVKNGIDEQVYKCIMNKQDFNLAIYANKE